MARGKLRLYLGAAPGVGKTFAMLNEGWRRKERGTDVVIGYVETHKRPNTSAQVRDLEIVPRKTVTYRDQSFEEMDLDAILARNPQVALVDELAHTNVEGCRHEKRWQDVETLLDAGIDVISTLNLQHLDSVNDVVERITGVAQRETVPDMVVRQADQIELVDMAPEALRRRLAHGNVYPAERIDAALANFFRAGNLAALRELALLWVADRVDEELHSYRERHGIAEPWETKERVVVTLTGAPSGDGLIRRAARMAMRSKAELVGVHVRLEDGVTSAESEGLTRHRALLEELGGRFVDVAGSDIARTLVQVAHTENATQLLIGASNRSRLGKLVRGSVVNSIIRHAGGALDIHIIATEAEETRAWKAPRARSFLPPLSTHRQLGALAMGVVGFPALTVLMTAFRTRIDLSTGLDAYLLLVIAVATVGGVWLALAAAVAAFLLSNWYFAPPIHTFTIGNARDILSLVAFLATAIVVSVLVDLVARRAISATRARADAKTLARMAGRLVAPEGNPLPVLLQDLLDAFRLDGVSIVHEDGGAWVVDLGVGSEPPGSPDQATMVLPLTENELLAFKGHELLAEDREVLAAFSAQMAAALDNKRLQVEAANADTLAEANEFRMVLLSTVSHDLRTPLASIKIATSSLLSTDITLPADEARELLETVDTEADRLANLVEGLLDMGRVQAGAVEVRRRAVGIEEAVDAALTSLGHRADEVDTFVPESLPLVSADPVLLERVVANLIDNALVHGGGKPVRLDAGAVAGRVDLRVVDRGPGIRRDDRERVFQPFQHLGDSVRRGVGLGLAIARGFTEAMDGELTIEDTPGGGCTMVVSLPVFVT